MDEETTEQAKRLTAEPRDQRLGNSDDAVQYFTAIRADVDCLLTRNPDEFPRRPAIPVLSPREFLAHFDDETAS
ncbi:MAG: hypothetical protein R6X33_11905 [Candidatus Brocadiia bacterium]